MNDFIYNLYRSIIIKTIIGPNDSIIIIIIIIQIIIIKK